MNGRRVMVVDDDVDVRELLAQLLELEGYQVTTAADGREALSRLAKGPLPSTILLDLRMPGMNGWEFRAHQLANPSLASIPVIILTADRTQDANTVARLGASALFRKPLDVDALLATLGQATAPAPGASGLMGQVH